MRLLDDGRPLFLPTLVRAFRIRVANPDVPYMVVSACDATVGTLERPRRRRAGCASQLWPMLSVVMVPISVFMRSSDVGASFLARRPRRKDSRLPREGHRPQTPFRSCDRSWYTSKLGMLWYPGIMREREQPPDEESREEKLVVCKLSERVVICVLVERREESKAVSDGNGGGSTWPNWFPETIYLFIWTTAS
ncbi:hypothetical protein BKA67DRAFT_529989 [Truncatella angustata]|uniref:Uncharacterized protein n=1 Tax=Truncatella angustata TaxID=152316 RepID=A0A9P8UVA2_9PEZI|nr:uncharacterized protein BKA67DRAFT_529989 [Truncatella angustata]KAH6659859.1 hypothetical protein BKA67DRAFT_529989 [Truncatella angustata]